MDVITLSGISDIADKIAQATEAVEALKEKAGTLRAKNVKSIQSGTCKFAGTVTITLPTPVDVSKSIVLTANKVMDIKDKYSTSSVQVRGGGVLKNSNTLTLSYSSLYTGSLSFESYSALVSWQVVEFDY